MKVFLLSIYGTGSQMVYVDRTEVFSSKKKAIARMEREIIIFKENLKRTPNPFDEKYVVTNMNTLFYYNNGYEDYTISVSEKEIE